MSAENSLFLQQLEEAEMVLIGIGEEFNGVKKLRENAGYNLCREKVEDTPQAWLIPALNHLFAQDKEELAGVLQRFADLIVDKNYFVVSVSTNDVIRQTNWREKRLVMPCGGSYLKQCTHKCNEVLVPVDEGDWCSIEEYKDELLCGSNAAELNLGVCPTCGEPLVLNNIYTEKYDEEGYLPQWQFYTKWLQGTLNRKLLVIELGVGMQCPSVIRFPFEKVAFFNQKASFWRINENLYQLSEEIKGKGTSISKNAIDWLKDLC